MLTMPDKTDNYINLGQKKELQLRIFKESVFTLLFFIFVLLFFIQSFRFPPAAARLPRLICSFTIIFLILQFILMFIRPKEYTVETTKNLYPKKLIWTILNLLSLPVLWHLIDYRVSILLVSECIMITLGIRNKIYLILIPPALAFGLYYLFTRFLYVAL